VDCLGPCDIARAGATLIGLQCADGGWPASAVLLVPDQCGRCRGEAHADDRRVLTTAMGLAALARLLDCGDDRSC